MTHARRPRSVASGLEFQPGNGDDSWYYVSLRLQYGKLIVHYEGLSDKCDEELEVVDMKSLKELYEKFRFPSRRLEDKNCQKVAPGCKVCVSCYPVEQESPETARYFDAALEKVCRFKHIRVSTEEQCMCTYDILWLAGPKKGQINTMHCENIYLLQSGCIESHPVLKDFARFLRCKRDCKSQFTVEKSIIKRYKLRNTGNPQADQFNTGNPQADELPTKNGYEFCNVDGSSTMNPYPEVWLDSKPHDIGNNFYGKTMGNVDVGFSHKYVVGHPSCINRFSDGMKSSHVFLTEDDNRDFVKKTEKTSENVVFKREGKIWDVACNDGSEYAWNATSMPDCLKTLYFDGHKREDIKSEEKFFPCSQVLLLENLEKDVAPSDVLGVIQQATSGWVKVYISPSRKFEHFTRGFVCFKDQASFRKAYEYLRSERISVVSSKGRPWVVLDAENGLCEGSFGGLTTGTEVLHPSFGSLVSNKIRILHKGTAEYEQAEILKLQFLDWRRGLETLHRRLNEEESEIERGSQ